MRILHVITSLQMGGAEKLMVDLLPRFIKKGIDCDLLTFDGTMTPFREILELSGMKIFDFGKGINPYSIKNILRLIPFLRKYDVIHTHNTAPQLFVAIASVLCPVVLVTTEHTTSNRRRGWKWYVPIDRWMYSRYKSIICISDKTKENLEKHLPNLHTNIFIIYNGIPIEDYSEAKDDELLKNDYHDCVKVMMVAGFRYQKDQPTVIRALLNLPENYHLFLVGDGVEREKCEQLTKDLELNLRVHFLGIRSNIPSLLKAADICVISSHWEGFGLAAVEGMAAGKPIVASDIPGVAEVVKGAGILFEKGNADDLAVKIRSLAENKTFYEQTVQMCRQRANKYSIDKMVDGYMNIYHKLL